MTLDFDVERFNEAVAENDEQHHESMRTFPSDVRELHAETRKALGGASRRDFLIRSALASTVLTFGSQILPMGSLFSGVAGAAEVLTDADIAAFAASLEYAAVAAYGAAAGSGKVTTPDVAAAAASFAAQHKTHGDAFAAAANGKIAKDSPNKTVLTALSTQLSQAADELDVVKLAFQVENAAAATYQFALGALEGVSYQQLTASILPIEAGHAAVLGQILFMGDTKADTAKTWLPPFQTEAGFVDPAKNPVA
ncbi:MAG: ferritin-like domain-containing protein [Acidimicrobiales bacterium]